MTQIILSSMDSDEVNSIGDNTESMQVANILRSSYYDLVARANLPETYTLFSLEASGDISKPTLMTIPSNINSVKWIKYDKATLEEPEENFREIKYLPLADFLSLTHAFNTEEDNVETFTKVIGTSNITFLYENDRAPCYFTSFDDNTIIFDSYDADVDRTLQKSKTVAWGETGNVFLLEDDFIPNLDSQQFALLLNEAKSLAFAEMKQVSHAKAEKLAKRGWVSLQHTKDKLGRFDKLPYYGRK